MKVGFTILTKPNLIWVKILHKYKWDPLYTTPVNLNTCYHLWQKLHGL